MIALKIRIHPGVLFSFENNSADLIIRVENKDSSPYWIEADITIPEGLSLSPIDGLQKGRLRVGIVGGNEFLEKSVKVYANRYSEPRIYGAAIILYSYDKNGVIESRQIKKANIRCETKKEESF